MPVPASVSPCETQPHEGLTLAFGTPIITEFFDPEVFGDRLDQVDFLIDHRDDLHH